MAWLDFIKSPFMTVGHSRRRRVIRNMSVDCLEPRLLLTAVVLTDSEQYVLELVNRARANPTAEAARYKIALNSGVPADELISTAPKQPLAPQQDLAKSALLHTQDMLQRDYFDHVTLGTGTTFSQRVTDQGYKWNRVAENIGYSASTVDFSQTKFLNTIHEGLIKSAGHRINIMDPELVEVGIGARLGSFKDKITYQFTEMVTENFGKRTGIGPYITGVAYTDSDKDGFYTIGESIRGGTVSAENVATGAIFSDSIGISGAYGLIVPAGSYTVTAKYSLNGSPQVFVHKGTVAVGANNVKVDFNSNLITFPPIVDLNGAGTGTGFEAEFRSLPVAIVGTTSTVTDGDNANLSSLTAAITNFQAGDTLDVTVSSGITKTFSAGVLTLRGSGTLSAYQTVLRTLIFNTTSTNSTSRTIAVKANDGGGDGPVATATVKIQLVTTPIIDLNGSASGTGFTAKFNATPLAVVDPAGLTVTDIDSLSLVSATATIRNAMPGDTLNVTLSGRITAEFRNGVLALTGSATLADYQSVLRTLIFDTTSEDTTIRTIAIKANDGTADGSVATATVTFQGSADLTGDGKFDSTDGFLMSLMDAGASDATIDRLKGGSTLSVAEIKAQWTTGTAMLDVNGDGMKDSTDGFLVVLVDSGAQDSTIDRLKFSNVRTAQQIKDYVNNTLNNAVPATASDFLAASADVSNSEKSNNPVPAVPVVNTAVANGNSRPESGDLISSFSGYGNQSVVRKPFRFWL